MKSNDYTLAIGDLNVNYYYFMKRK